MNKYVVLAAKLLFTLLVLSTGVLVSSVSAEPLPSREEMWEIIQRQQKQIDALKNKQQEIDQKADAVTDVVEQQQASISDSGSSDGWWKDTQIGGYGEVHYNGGDKDEIDFHRFVVMLNHQFNDRLRLFTEVELEHALSGEGKEGEVELEQAYIEYDLSDAHRAKAGLFLIPVGILNEVHEPTTFYGVERNPVESNIIPSTWWEAGVGTSGDLPAHLKYDLAFHSGLKTPIDGDNAFKIRNGRQKVSEAKATDGAVTARLRWAGISGVELGISGQYQNDVTQRESDEGVEATLASAHANIQQGPFGFRALYARWDLDGDAPEAIGRDVQEGWYVEPSYRTELPLGELGFFARYNQYDNNAGSSLDTEFDQYDVGLNYWPHQDVVLKADMAFIDAPSSEDDDEILNLGVGFSY